MLTVIFFLITAASLFNNIRSINKRYEGLAVTTGRSVFETIVAARRWNALQSGIYVPVTERVQPNPYLVDPLRDITATNGMRLTKVNPAYMSRLIAEVLNKEKKVQLKIISLNPLRPDNSADAWEKVALRSFERGSGEEFSVFGEGDGAVFRYMGVLKTEESCLKCHGKQGYKVGDVRGGISISFPYAPFQKAASEGIGEAVFEHSLLFLIGVTIILLMGKKLVDNVGRLQDALQHINRLEGMLPICSACKKIREEKDGETTWVPIESYIRTKTDVEFSHGICPDCMKRLYPEFKHLHGKGK
ncbi:MAG: DUF3365 domain-containing protein [Nitrospirales bacterium]|nr:DUF3365 domain-containing protein [Nitrospirales bacterium]